SRRRIPDEILSAAHDRARARSERNWPEADRLRGVIESAGWKIVDHGTDFALSPVAAPTVEEPGGVARFGASRDVPSRLDEPSHGLATVVLVATDWPTDTDRALAGLRAHSPEASIVVVADGPSAEQELALADAEGLDVVRTAERLGQA